jgi:hypothetical protein
VLKAARLTYFFCDDAVKLIRNATAIMNGCFIAVRQSAKQRTTEDNSADTLIVFIMI